ncbi:MAG: PqqD family protein [Candidatus Omnitrophota bacterium]
MRIDDGYCYRRNEQIIRKDLYDCPALIDPYRMTLVKLNPTAESVWQLFDGEHSVAGILDILKNEFEVDAKALEKDLRTFLNDLIRREMIR